MFHFDGYEPERAVEDKIDLRPCGCTPVVERVAQPVVVVYRTKLLMAERFEGDSPDLFGRIQRT